MDEYTEPFEKGHGRIDARKASMAMVNLNEMPNNYSVELYSKCAHHFLRNFTCTGKDLIYCATPYLIETRRSARRFRFDYTDAEHVERLKLLYQTERRNA